MSNRSQDWLKQAENDLAHAEECLAAQRYEWACFVSHQAAEMAVKAIHQSRGQEAWGQTVRALLEDLGPDIQIPDTLLHGARVLDGYYIPTRYPNGHPGGAPYEHYDHIQGAEAIAHARQTVELARLQMAGS
jgi:HEPN domain-containing protein